MTFNAPRGTFDVLPEESYKWQYIEKAARETAHKFNYLEVHTPIFEESALFSRGIGASTDIVEKEMYTFLDKSGRSLTLRPEGTAGIARSFVENKINSLWKVYYFGSFFRYERPQAGRFRQHHQFGIEAIGSIDPALDLEVISLAIDFYNTLGLENLSVSLNSIGCKICRPAFKEALIDFVKLKIEKFCGDCQRRLDYNPLRVFDCKKKNCQLEIKSAPLILDFLCKECDEHFSMLKKMLENLKINYQVNPYLVRGLDYYTKTVFEIISSSLGAQNSLCGGGRYDNLIEELGGKITPAVGFALGIERVILVLEKEGNFPAPLNLDFFLIVLTEEAENLALMILRDLRKNAFSIEKDYLKRNFKGQLKQADHLKVKFSLIIGEDELKKGKLTLKNMQSGIQEEIPLENLADNLKLKLKK